MLGAGQLWAGIKRIFEPTVPPVWSPAKWRWVIAWMLVLLVLDVTGPLWVSPEFQGAPRAAIGCILAALGIQLRLRQVESAPLWNALIAAGFFLVGNVGNYATRYRDSGVPLLVILGLPFSLFFGGLMSAFSGWLLKRAQRKQDERESLVVG